MNKAYKIKVGSSFWFSKLLLVTSTLSLLVFLLSLAILYTGKGLPLEMSGIYYGEIMHNYVYYSFSISLVFCILGFKVSDMKKWTKTDLIIDGDTIQFTQNNEPVLLPRQKILKVSGLKTYFTKDIKLRIRTNGLKRYYIKVDDNTYNKLAYIYSDRFY